MVTHRRHTGKKEPRYLEDITLTVDSGREAGRPDLQEDLFASGSFLGLYDEKRILDKLKVGMTEISTGKATGTSAFRSRNRTTTPRGCTLIQPTSRIMRRGSSS